MQSDGKKKTMLTRDEQFDIYERQSNKKLLNDYFGEDKMLKEWGE
jgi:hypothetical protein